jgi:hypothetical protein
MLLRTIRPGAPRSRGVLDLNGVLHQTNVVNPRKLCLRGRALGPARAPLS